MRVLVSIDELVVDGVDPRDRHRIGDALEAALAARLARPGTALRLVGRGDAEAVRVAASLPPARGAAIGSMADALATALSGAPDGQLHRPGSAR